MAGPLTGLKIVELAGLVAGPFCGMLLADLGAEVIRIDRPGAADARSAGPPPIITDRGRKSLTIDLKRPAGVSVLLELTAIADVFFESFRPGVAERLGFGPAECHARNKRLVYGRLTGWGQAGPLAPSAGHDINYVALSGVLAQMGAPDQIPRPPLNLVGDLAGGGMLLAFGILAAVLHAKRTGEGQVVDAAMVEGASTLMTTAREYMLSGAKLSRGHIPSDGGHPLYTVYQCKDGRYVSIGCMEPQFQQELLRVLKLHPEFLSGIDDPTRWPALQAKLSPIFLEKTRDEWCAIMEYNPQLCFAPVLTLDESPSHPHFVQRGSYICIGDVVQPSPAPRFSRSIPDVPAPAPPPGQDASEAILKSWLGKTSEQIGELRQSSAFGPHA